MKDAQKLKMFLIRNAVPIVFLVVSAIAIPISRFSMEYLVQEMLIRLSRNSFLVLSLLVPIMAGMGLNFGMVLGAMAGQIGLIFVSDWNIVGVHGMMLAALIATPLAILFGWLCGVVLNKARGREMVTSYILGFFMNGVYQLVVLYGFGSIEIPVATFIVIGLFCLFIVWFRKTKLGQDMRATGQDMEVANSSGIPVLRTRVISIVISTVLACYGQIIFLQNVGTMNTYNSHEQAGVFAIASLLVGGASVTRASIVNVFAGVVLFHLMFVVSPMAGKYLIGEAQIGEFFRVFVSYGIISLALVLHAWRRHADRERAREQFRGESAEGGKSE